jgi:indole-3-glycerol phosphate synthase
VRTILDTIMDERRAAVAAAKAQVSMAVLREQAVLHTPVSLAARLASGVGPQIIAETKKASPSAGLLRPDYAPGDIAAGYENAGACGVSVLTEPLHFQGCEADLRAVCSRVSIPVLRKDFMCDPYQVAEAAAWGADVILLIVAALDDAELSDLHAHAQSYGMDTLVESHTSAELERALALPNAIIGVNSRNLKTLVTDLDVARDLAEMIPEDRLSVAESGIKTVADIEDLASHGYDGFLIGEALVCEGDPAGRLGGLLGAEVG